MANKYVFIKAQPNDAKHWMNVYNGINLMNVGTNINPKFGESPDQIDTFIRREMRPSIARSTAPTVDATKTPLQFGYKAFGQLTEDFVEGIDHELMMSKLDSMEYPHAFVGYGYFFDTENTEAVATSKIITNSVYFCRDEEGHIINAKTGRRMQSNWNDGRYKFAVWYVMLKITSDMYYMVVDPTLANIYENIEVTHDDAVFAVMDAHDGTLNDTILKPTFGRGSLHMSDNLVVATGKSFKVDPFGESVFRWRYTDYDCKSIDLRVKTNLKYKSNDDGSMTFEPPEDGQIGYIYMRVPVKSAIIDQASIGVDSVRRSYIVVKG
jgi:hypothetical protein